MIEFEPRCRSYNCCHPRPERLVSFFREEAPYPFSQAPNVSEVTSARVTSSPQVGLCPHSDVQIRCHSRRSPSIPRARVRQSEDSICRSLVIPEDQEDRPRWLGYLRRSCHLPSMTIADTQQHGTRTLIAADILVGRRRLRCILRQQSTHSALAYELNSPILISIHNVLYVRFSLPYIITRCRRCLTVR